MLRYRGCKVGRLFVEIPDELDQSFRMKVLELHGAKKGALGKSVKEALELWLESKK